MRYSEGVKQNYEDNKRRIFNEIIAAAEAEKTADISQTDNIAIIKDQEKEGITMKNTNMENTMERARIRSSKGGIIAAACAMLVVGGGVFAANHMSGAPNIAPGSAGTSLTTSDAEDTTDFETDENENDEERISIEDGIWWNNVDPAFAELMDTADFVGEVQVISSQMETIDGVDYIDYFCAMTDDNGNSGTVFKYTGEDELPNRLSIMQRAADGMATFGEGDKLLVVAKDGVESESGGFSFEMSEPAAAFHFEGGVQCYRNVAEPGQVNDLGDYDFGLYEKDLDQYYRIMLGNAVDNGDISTIVNWCDYHFVEYRTYEREDEPKDSVTVYWFAGDPIAEDEDFIGIVFEIGTGEIGEAPEAAYDDNTDLNVSLPLPDGLLGSYLVEGIYNGDVLYATYFDSSEVTGLDLPIPRIGDAPLTVQITSAVTEKSVTYATLVVEYEKGTFEIIGDLNMEGLLEITPVEDMSIGVETSGEGGLIESFEGYTIELSEVGYSSVTGVNIVFSISKADGIPFPEDYLENNSLELIYGDLNPFMSAVQADELDIGKCRLSEDGKSVEVAMSTAHAVDPAKIDTDNEITIQVNSIVENGEVAAEGLFEARFSFVNNET